MLMIIRLKIISDLSEFGWRLNCNILLAYLCKRHFANNIKADGSEIELIYLSKNTVFKSSWRNTSYIQYDSENRSRA